MTAPPLRTHAAIAMLLLGTSENEIEKERAYTKSAERWGKPYRGEDWQDRQISGMALPLLWRCLNLIFAALYSQSSARDQICATATLHRPVVASNSY